MRISTKKILITILIAALSSILIFSISCSSTEDPINYDGINPPGGDYIDTGYVGTYTNKATVTINGDGSCKIAGTARGGVWLATNQTNMSFEIRVGGWANYSDDIFKEGRATNITIISPTDIKMLSAYAYWRREDSGNHYLGVTFDNEGSTEERIHYGFGGTN